MYEEQKRVTKWFIFWNSDFGTWTIFNFTGILHQQFEFTYSFDEGQTFSTSVQIRRYYPDDVFIVNSCFGSFWLNIKIKKMNHKGGNHEKWSTWSSERKDIKFEEKKNHFFGGFHTGNAMRNVHNSTSLYPFQ